MVMVSVFRDYNKSATEILSTHEERGYIVTSDRELAEQIKQDIAKDKEFKSTRRYLSQFLAPLRHVFKRNNYGGSGRAKLGF